MLDCSPSTLLRNWMRVTSTVGQVRKLAVLGVVLLSSTAADAKIIYVNGADATPGNGTTWASSFKYLQQALKVAVAGDSIYMAKGTYYPDDGVVNGTGDRELSFEINGLKIYGGFAGTETSLDQRDPEANPTILSGEIFPLTPETPGYERYWSLHVVVLKGSSTLDGLTVEKGRANGNDPARPENQGGGCVVPAGMTLTLVNCTFSENHAALAGGAIWGKVVATGCTFSDNFVNNEERYNSDPDRPRHWLYNPNCSGGAIKGDVTAVDCQFLNNYLDILSLDLGVTCSATGGAISGTTIKVTDCVFEGNTASSLSDWGFDSNDSDATSSGGAISGADTVAKNCTFANNLAEALSSARESADPKKATGYAAKPTTKGGAITGKLTAVNCAFSKNSVFSEVDYGDRGICITHGGALFMDTLSSLVNCTFTENAAECICEPESSAFNILDTRGGAVHAVGPELATPTVISNSTFLDNRSTNTVFYTSSPPPPDIPVTTVISYSGAGAALSCAARVNVISNIFWYSDLWIDDLEVTSMLYVSGTGRISNRLYPTPLTETINIVRDGIETVTSSSGADIDFGTPTTRTLLNEDPMFADADNPAGDDGLWGTADDGLRLTAGSSAIGLGHPLFIPKDTLDVDDDKNITENIPSDAAGFVRVQDGTMELGAYELGDTIALAEIVVEKPVGTGLVDGVSVMDFSLLRGITQTFTIKNTGGGDLKNLKVTGDGTDIAAFQFTQPAVTQLATNQSTTFTVKFNPAALGPRTAAIHIASNDADENTFDISLKGTPPAPDIAVEFPVNTNLVDGTSVIAYGNVTLSSPVTKKFTIRNTGAGNLSLGGITSSSADFKVSGLGQTSLAPGLTTTFNVTFSPSSNGLKKASIIIANNDFDAESQFLIQVSGNGLVPDIAVEYPVGTGLADGSSVINYGGVIATSSASRTFTIRNSGMANLNIQGIYSSGTNAANFTASAPAQAILAPGATTTFKVTFKPSGMGIRNASIVIQSNDPDSESAFLVKVTGSGLGAPEIFVSQPYSSEIVDGATNDFGSVQKSLLHSKTFIIKNTGLGTLSNIAVSLTGAPAFTKTQLPVTSLSPGAQAKFTVTFKPGSLGKKTAVLQITSNDANEGDLDINLVGTCIALKSSSLTEASDSLAERRSEGSGGVVTVMKDSEGLKYLVLTVEKSANWSSRKHTVEVSRNLMDWFSGRKHTTTLVNNAKILKVRDDTPIRDGKKRYIRVR